MAIEKTNFNDLTQSFRKEKENYGHTHTNSSKSQIDFIMIYKKWINSAHNCEAYCSFEAVYSDHRIIHQQQQSKLVLGLIKS